MRITGDGGVSVEQALVIRLWFTAEAAPPWLRADDPHHARSIVDLRLNSDQLAAAAREWTRQLNALPGRPWAEPASQPGDPPRP